jgi:plastocyanin
MNKEDTMKRSILSVFCVAVLVMSGSGWAQADDDGNDPASVTVSFGAGLNTAQAGNAANHHVLPRVIRVKLGGVVNFVVAGFHQIFVYKPGTKPEDITVPAFPPNLFINDFDNLFYLGVNPGPNPPPSPLPPGVPPLPAGTSDAQNRVESVSFPTPGTYLVICNVNPHFRDGMFAFVRVGGDDD